MRFGKLSCILVLFLAGIALAAGAASAANVPVELLEIELDETPLHTGINVLNIEKGERVDIDVKIMSNMSADYVQIKALISGYDYPDDERVYDRTPVFAVEPNVSYWKSLDLEIPGSMDDDMYKLRIVISDRANDENIYTYNLKISSEDHSMEIRDVIFSPEYGVDAGKVFQTIARIRNNGQKDEESVKVTVSVPDLNIRGSSYIDTVESEDSVTSEEIWLRVPECAKTGFYDAVVTITYDEGYSTVSSVESLAVTGDFCTADKGKDDGKKADDTPITNFVTSSSGNNNNNNQNSNDAQASRKDTIRKMLESSLIVLVIALVIAGLVIGVIKLLREGREF